MCVSVSVRLSARISLERQARPLPIFTLPMVVARSSSGRVTQFQAERDSFGGFFPIGNAL